MAARYWGEEKEPEAVYAVFLRKVRYRAPNVLAGVTVSAAFHDVGNESVDGRIAVPKNLLASFRYHFGKTLFSKIA